MKFEIPTSGPLCGVASSPSGASSQVAVQGMPSKYKWYIGYKTPRADQNYHGSVQELLQSSFHSSRWNACSWFFLPAVMDSRSYHSFCFDSALVYFAVAFSNPPFGGYPKNLNLWPSKSMIWWLMIVHRIFDVVWSLQTKPGYNTTHLRPRNSTNNGLSMKRLFQWTRRPSFQPEKLLWLFFLIDKE